MELSKYIKSESVELNRSAIHFADYNPRKLSEESRKTLKRGIKKFGLVGGIVVNKQTGLTVVSGHQRLTVMDELQKFPEKTLSKILCKWKRDSVISLFLYLDSVFKHKHKLIHNQAPVMNRLCPFLLNLHK